jgi:RNA polymerase sigma factor (sigma-70 family)
MSSSLASGTTLRHLRDLFSEGTAVGLSDAQLLARYTASKDGPAFESLVARHGPMVLATCHAILQHEQDVEDAFQATFLVLARKAGSVRAGDALGGWLHRVAYRVAVQANIAAQRRRRHESEVLAMEFPCAARPGLEPDVRSIVHEEIERLPERHRLPVVLCDLEGLTYEQAAGQLDWTEPTLRCRLAKARHRLRDRLTRRDVTGAALGLAIRSSRASAAVPAAWAQVAVAAATGGAASAAVAALTRTLIRSMLMTKLKVGAMAVLAAAALVSAGVVAVGAGRPDEPKTTMRAAATAKAPPAVAKAKAAAPEPAPGEMVEVRGRVVGPDGKPVQGATVRRVWEGLDDAPVPEATSASDGRFLARIPRPSRSTRMVGGAEDMPWIAAAAPGFGPGWVARAVEAAAAGELTIRLVPDGPPIEGRIVDLQGRPVAGAQVKVDRLWYAKAEGSWYVETGDLPAWLERVRDRGIRQGPWDGLTHLPTPIVTATTGPDGRFRLTGIGRERIAELIVSGRTIATTLIYAMCHDGPEIHGIDQDSRQPRMIVFHAPRFEQAVAPTQPIEGSSATRTPAGPSLECDSAAWSSTNTAWSGRRASKRPPTRRAATTLAA